jgi:acyl-CoA synthetase (AMP-forming)/AMP-acid ligase II
VLLADLLTAAPPKAPALAFGDQAWTFDALADDVTRVAALVAGRTAPGDRVALIGRNRPGYLSALYGIPLAGRVAVPLNQRLAPAELEAQVRKVGAALVVSDLPGAVPWAEWEAEVAATAPEPDLPRPAAGDPAWILFTSGTTGSPKGAVLTQASILAAVQGANAARPVADDDVYLFCFPLCHVAAYNVACLHARGRPVVLMEGFDGGALPGLVARHRVTTLSLAPTMLAMLLDDPGFDSGAFATLRQVAYGASSMAPDLLRRGTDALGVGFAQGYGMTELSGNAVFLDEAGHRAALGDSPHLLRAAGHPSPLAEVRIAGDGEIMVRGPQVMAGYWEETAATAATIVDGWLHTGDLGEMDADGYLYVLDRAKDIVVTGGENVSSREVEDVLSTHPAVGQVAVIGVPDARWGEAVCAVVVARNGTVVTLEDLVAHTRGVLGGFKKPRRLVLVDELPTNASGKVLKRDLRAQVVADG